MIYAPQIPKSTHSWGNIKAPSIFVNISSTDTNVHLPVAKYGSDSDLKLQNVLQVSRLSPPRGSGREPVTHVHQNFRYFRVQKAKKGNQRGEGSKSDGAPLEEMVPSSYFLTKITSTKSRGEIIPIAAEGVTVLQTETSWKGEEEMA